ncbi:hypothetical protein [Nonomuraea rhizosphaerae]|uniref:hypothetical protein n=1 Tax=Nonomuraea rhizosphaerae TaxID=2665663 RepID=UPI001C5FF088|nr:hypothetical protein [Nonomuraea rhizosphaerae]
MRKAAVRSAVAALLGIGLTGGLLAATSSPALAAGRWCTGDTCLKTYDVGTWHGRVEVQIWARPNMTVHGRVWNSAGWAVNTQVESFTSYRTYIGYTYPKRNFPAGSQLCAEGWWHRGGSHYTSLGRRCVTVTR